MDFTKEFDDLIVLGRMLNYQVICQLDYLMFNKNDERVYSVDISRSRQFRISFNFKTIGLYNNTNEVRKILTRLL